jgi:hypothetical protein
MWPHEIANGKWLLYPMRVELEGGQGPGKRGICSPRPNILQLVRLRGRVGEEPGVGERIGRNVMQLGESLWVVEWRCHLTVAVLGGTPSAPSSSLSRMWTAGIGGGESWGSRSRRSLQRRWSLAHPGGQCPLLRRET